MEGQELTRVLRQAQAYRKRKREVSEMVRLILEVLSESPHGVLGHDALQKGLYKKTGVRADRFNEVIGLMVDKKYITRDALKSGMKYKRASTNQ